MIALRRLGQEDQEFPDILSGTSNVQHSQPIKARGSDVCLKSIIWVWGMEAGRSEV